MHHSQIDPVDPTDSFAEDFQHFDRDDFEAFKKDDIKRLRNQLRSKGVIVRVKWFLSISDALVEAIQEELTWPENDPDRPQFRLPQYQTSTPSNPMASTAPNINLPVPKIIPAPNMAVGNNAASLSAALRPPVSFLYAQRLFSTCVTLLLYIHSLENR